MKAKVKVTLEFEVQVDKDRSYLEEELGIIGESIADAINDDEFKEGISDGSGIYIQDYPEWDAEVIEVTEENLSYDEAVAWLEEEGISCDASTIEGEIACDELDYYDCYTEEIMEEIKSSIEYKLEARKGEEED